MDNSTYDVLNLSPNNSNETYSTLATVPTTVNQRYEAQLARISSHSTSVQTQATDMLTQPACGPGLWWRVTHLNMTDPSQQCPPVWRKYNTSGVRACGRPATSIGSCSATVYFIGCQYSRVCGRVIGYQFVAPDAFGRYANNDIDLDGIDIFHGAQRTHIWSYVAGMTVSSASSSLSWFSLCLSWILHSSTTC